MFDQDGDGTISTEELREVMTNLGQTVSDGDIKGKIILLKIHTRCSIWLRQSVFPFVQTIDWSKHSFDFWRIFFSLSTRRNVRRR